MADIQEILKHDNIICYRLLSLECKDESCKGVNVKCGSYSPFHTANYRRILESRKNESSFSELG